MGENNIVKNIGLWEDNDFYGPDALYKDETMAPPGSIPPDLVQWYAFELNMLCVLTCDRLRVGSGGIANCDAPFLYKEGELGGDIIQGQVRQSYPSRFVLTKYCKD